MSSDNGIHIRKLESGQYAVHHIFMSTDYNSEEEMETLKVCDTLEEAIEFGQKQYTEYGLSFNI